MASEPPIWKQLLVGSVIAVIGGGAGGYVTSTVEAKKRDAEFRHEVAKTELESIGKVARVLDIYESHVLTAYDVVDKRKFSIDVLLADPADVNRKVAKAVASADTAQEAFIGELRQQSYNLSDAEHQRLLDRYVASHALGNLVRRALEHDTLDAYSRKLASEFMDDVQASRETAQATSERLLKRDQSR
jgi:hypothetical protein